MERLRQILRRIDGRSYPAYRDLSGDFDGNGFTFRFLHIQGDPFASPSWLEVEIDREETAADGFDLIGARRVGVEDGLLRSVSGAVRDTGRSRGSGKSGRWGVLHPGQEMLERSALTIRDGIVRLRMTVGLPAKGRRVSGREAETMLVEELDTIVERGLIEASVDIIESHADAAEDFDALQGELTSTGAVAFIARGAVLPRRSGVDDRPLERDGVRVWAGPESLEHTVTLPNAGEVRGTLIPAGVTLICGGGFHGKSTLLSTLTHGYVPHIPGDGRELCACRPDAVAVRAEDGRSVAGSTSQGHRRPPRRHDDRVFLDAERQRLDESGGKHRGGARAGASCLLIDEDTSATNFMVRDRRMQELVAAAHEPITPFVDRVAELRDDHGISSVIVAGGVGDFFDVADTVIVMREYVPHEETQHASRIATQWPSERRSEERAAFALPPARVPTRHSVDAQGRGHKKRDRSRARGTRSIELGTDEIDLTWVTQLLTDAQARTVADALLWIAREGADGERSVRALCDAFVARVEAEGIGSTRRPTSGAATAPRCGRSRSRLP